MESFKFKGNKDEFLKWWDGRTPGQKRKGSEMMGEGQFIIVPYDETEHPEEDPTGMGREEDGDYASKYFRGAFEGEDARFSMPVPKSKPTGESSSKTKEAGKPDEDRQGKDDGKYGEVPKVYVPSGFSNRLKSVFKDNSLDRIVRNRLSGNLDMKHLYKVTTSPRIFETRGDVAGKRYSVVLLVDCSGSMQESRKVNMAVASTETLIQQFDGIVDLQVMTFNVFTETFKKFGEKIRPHQLRERIGTPIFSRTYGSYAYGNHDWQAIRDAGHQLLKNAHGGKKILITLSDGLPECSYGRCHNKACCLREGYGSSISFLSRTKDSALWAESMGITTIGVGIKHDAVNKIYKNNVVVTDINKLCESMVEILNKTVKRKTS